MLKRYNYSSKAESQLKVHNTGPEKISQATGLVPWCFVNQIESQNIYTTVPISVE